MRLHYKGKYNGDESSLPQRKHPSNAVKFKEPDSMRSLAIIANIIAIVIGIIFFVILGIVFLRYLERSSFDYRDLNALNFLLPCFASLLVLFPHEFLHAICFKKDVYLYTNWSKFLLFVVGTEDMSKFRFIFLSLLPNLIFGFIPFAIFLFIPQWIGLGLFGAACIASGAGDYINVFNAITQVPNKAIVYMSGMHSYWYMKND